MKPLAPPDSFHLQAAQGWLGLGCVAEAHAELDQIAPQLRVHADVLELRWQMAAEARQWEACLEIATTLTRIDPRPPVGWIYKSQALHELKRTREAWDNLLPVADKFTQMRADRHVIPYNLARYGCRLGRLAEARAWLTWAFTVSSDAPALKLRALEEPDLGTLWLAIDKMRTPVKPPVRHQWPTCV
jgi:hypothetical protein